MALKIKIKQQEPKGPIEMKCPEDNSKFKKIVPSMNSNGEVSDGQQRLSVYVNLKASQAIWEHARRLDMKYEVGGALIGYYCRAGKGAKDPRFLVVTDVLNMPPDYFKSPALLRFTNDFMDQLDSYMEQLNNLDPNLRRLGFYHTHPGYGVFLSATDIKTFEGIFKEDWQIAMVVDPVREDEGVFYWQGGKISHKNGFYYYIPHKDEAKIEVHQVSHPKRNLRRYNLHSLTPPGLDQDDRQTDEKPPEEDNDQNPPDAQRQNEPDKNQPPENDQAESDSHSTPDENDDEENMEEDNVKDDTVENETQSEQEVEKDKGKNGHQPEQHARTGENETPDQQKPMEIKDNVEKKILDEVRKEGESLAVGLSSTPVRGLI